MTVVTALDDLAAATGADPLIMWAADRPGTRSWIRPGAVAVACPDLSRRDRMPVYGEPAAVAELLREVLPQVGPTFRPLGDEPLLAGVAERVPELPVAGRFAWMETSEPVATPAGRHVRWLDDEDLPAVTALLDDAFPESYARPGAAGVHRWAAVRDDDGRLVTVAADAWSAPRVGFLAGVATRPDMRGRGLAAAVCGFATDELLAGRDRVALFADYWNTAAIATYRRLGFRLRPVAAAHVQS
jgi:GNAT superfamily N-acetyltransferase